MVIIFIFLSPFQKIITSAVPVASSDYQQEKKDRQQRLAMRASASGSGVGVGGVLGSSIVVMFAESSL